MTRAGRRARTNAGQRALTPAGGRTGLLRVGVWSVTALGLGVAAHAQAAALPAVGAVVLPAPLLVAAALWFGRRERGVAELFASLGLAQVLLHLWFHAASCAGHPMAGMVHHAAPGSAASRPVAAAAVALSSSHELPSPGMAAAHAAAVLLAACLLGWGERSLWAMARRWAPALPGAAAVALLPRRAPLLPPAGPIARITGASLAARGPPTLLAC